MLSMGHRLKYLKLLQSPFFFFFFQSSNTNAARISTGKLATRAKSFELKTSQKLVAVFSKYTFVFRMTDYEPV